MLTNIDLAIEDAIKNKDSSWFRNLIDINTGKFDEIDNEIHTIEEVCIWIKSNKPLYYWNMYKNEISLIDSCTLDFIIKSNEYRFGITRNMQNGIIKFLRTPERMIQNA